MKEIMLNAHTYHNTVQYRYSILGTKEWCPKIYRLLQSSCWVKKRLKTPQELGNEDHVALLGL